MLVLRWSDVDLERGEVSVRRTLTRGSRGNGQVLHGNVVSKRFRKLARILELPCIRFHDLRHTAATLMLANREHPKIVQERLGHSDISMPLNKYSHGTMGMQREAAVRLDALLGSERD